MAVTRIVPDITSRDIPRSRDFYRLLGLEERMDLGWVVILGPPDQRDGLPVRGSRRSRR